MIMKKMLLVSSLIAGLLAGCEQVDTGKHPEGGVLVTVGYDKKEWYVTNDITHNDNGRKDFFVDGNEYRTNDVFNEYPFYTKEELESLKKKFNLKDEFTYHKIEGNQDYSKNGIVVILGSGRNEFYIVKDQPSLNNDGSYSFYVDGKEYRSNDVVNSYEFDSLEELNDILKRFGFAEVK